MGTYTLSEATLLAILGLVALPYLIHFTLMAVGLMIGAISLLFSLVISMWEIVVGTKDNKEEP